MTFFIWLTSHVHVCVHPDGKGECEHDEGSGDDRLCDICGSKFPDIIMIFRQPSILRRVTRECYVRVWLRAVVDATERTSQTEKIALMLTPRMKTRRKIRWSDE